MKERTKEEQKLFHIYETMGIGGVENTKMCMRLPHQVK